MVFSSISVTEVEIVPAALSLSTRWRSLESFAEKYDRCLSGFVYGKGRLHIRCSRVRHRGCQHSINVWVVCKISPKGSKFSRRVPETMLRPIVTSQLRECGLLV